MTPLAKSPGDRASNARPLDFHHWLASQGMNPNRHRPPGRTAALLMDYRRYLVQEVGQEKAGVWFEKYARRAESTPAEKSS